MDETDNKSAGEAAKDAAKNLVGDAGKTLDEIKGKGLMSFFRFDTMYFPLIASYFFIIICALTAISIVIGIFGSFATMFAVGFMTGLIALFWAVVMPLVGLVFIRIFFETVLVGFKINDAVQDLRKSRGV